MGIPGDDVVVIQNGKKPGDPDVITVNCPDKTGLGCDICRIILDFGVYITKGDVSTDEIWCYMVFWVVPHFSSPFVRWPNLKNRLQSAETGRYLFSDREWEVYGFLLDENCKFQLSSMVARNQIVDRVRRTLMGWLLAKYKREKRISNVY